MHVNSNLYIVLFVLFPFLLKLNPSKPMPVMVWIYGGGFQMGEASRDLYGPDYLMMENIVLVTIAYRLGPLGKSCELFVYFLLKIMKQ